MKKIYKIIFAIIIQSAIINLQSFSQTIPVFEWAKNAMIVPHGNQVSSNYPSAICVDANANSYSTGYFRDSILFYTTYLYSPLAHNIFIVSYNSSGSLRWAKKAGAASGCDPDGGMVYDHTGNIYIAGTFNDSIIFDAYTYYSIASGKNSFIARYDTSGNFQWAKIFFTNGISNYIKSLHADYNGNLFAAGTYADSLQIDAFNMLLPASDNFYFIKFDAAGVQQFIKTGFATYTGNLKITSDNQSSIYLAGFFNGTVTINTTSASGKGSFLAGFNPAGILSWMNLIQGSPVIVTGLETTISGKLYAAGFYNDSIAIGTTTFYTPGITHNVFTAQYDTSGSFQWAKRIDVVVNNQIRIDGMTATDAYIYVTGEFDNFLTFNGFPYNSSGGRDVYVAAYSSSGIETWFKKAGSSNEDYSYSIEKDAAKNLYVTGAAHCPAYFDNIVVMDTTVSFIGAPTTFVAKINNSAILSVNAPDNSSNNLYINPNPLTTQSKLIFKNTNKEKFLFTLCDITGRVTESVSTTNNEIILTKGSKQPGVYLFHFDKLSVTNEKTGERMNGKIVIQ